MPEFVLRDEATGEVVASYPTRKQAAIWAFRRRFRVGPTLLEGPDTLRRYHRNYGAPGYRIPCPNGCGRWTYPRAMRGNPPEMCRECRRKAGPPDHQRAAVAEANRKRTGSEVRDEPKLRAAVA